MYRIYVGVLENKNEFKSNLINPFKPSVIWIKNEGSDIRFMSDSDRLNRLKFLYSRRENLINVCFSGRTSIEYKQISFNYRPSKDLIKASLINKNNKSDLEEELVIMSLEFLFYIQSYSVSKNIQQQWLDALYTTLSNFGLLHILFESEIDSFSKRVYICLKNMNSEEQNITNVCSYIGVSKATLMRKLKKENNKFKNILKLVRMEKAMLLIESGITDLEWISISCGYQSYNRFRKYFEDEFKILPEEVLINSNANQ
ncbi:helix-turn-helix domain-containing protein [Vibrio vulnificus]|nr:helix-turn-helix domain-containing protein [Vibrio vulnificus]